MPALTLGQSQELFSRQVAQLLAKAFELGMEVRIGEVLRPQEMQDIYLKTGRSKIKVSQHMKKLAIDLNLFKAGAVCTVAEISPLGKWWESLDEKNRWGGSWRGLVEAGKSSFVDSPHFERAD